MDPSELIFKYLFMVNYSSSMTFLQFPREIRDLVYSFIAPRNETYTAISCIWETTLPRVINSASPDVGILWTSKAVQHEFLESVCATNTFKFLIFEGHAPVLVQPLPQHDANLLRRVAIDFDVIVNIAPALRMFSHDKAKRKDCLIFISNDSAINFPQNLFDALDYVVGFETVEVVRMFECDNIDAERLQLHMEAVLGPSSIHQKKDKKKNIKSYVFHPWDFLPKRGW